MNKRIITLQGKSKTGKTTTIRKLIEKIENQYTVTELFNGEDRVISADIKGKKLGITSCGDTKSALENDFAMMGDCDLYVCASRTKGDTIDFLNEQTKFGVLITHGKWYFSSTNNSLDDDIEHVMINEQQVNAIYDQIMELI